MKPIQDMLEAYITSYTTYHSYYKEKSEMTKSIYKLSLLQPPFQLLLLLATLSNYIIKFMKLLYNMQNVSITWFAIYCLHYKDKLSNITWSFVFVADNFYSLCTLSNLLIAPAYVIELGLVMKKGEQPKTFLYLLFYQLLFLFLSLILSKICSTIFEYMWQYSNSKVFVMAGPMLLNQI